MDKLLINTMRLGRLSHDEARARSANRSRMMLNLTIVLLTAIVFFNLGVMLEKTKFNQMVSYDMSGRLQP